MAPTQSNINTLPVGVGWLADAPMFIDSAQVAAFYDAVITPEYEEGETALTISEEVSKELSGKLGVQGEVSPGIIAQALSKLFSFKFTATGEAAGGVTKDEAKTREVKLRRIATPQRQLVQLTLHYLVKQNNRLFMVTNEAASWPQADAILAVPRALAFVDLPPETLIIPAAAEFGNGNIVPLYKELGQNAATRQPPYPERASPSELKQQRKQYWSWFHANVTPMEAMRAVEKAAATHGRIRWIDYRLMLSTEGDSAHLHVCPREQYDTGVLAYNLVKRGNKHGLRVVGTLRSEPDVNVLAIYDK